ncbi:MAG: tRNA pseudouridine(55) synthase TruB [Patescibacteria group bacterium]
MSNEFLNLDRLLLIDKPKGITSFDVIRRLRKVHNIRKMGHAGTLDPLATGLMIIGVGKGTKKLTGFIKLDKEYEGEIEFGKISDTYDADGVIKNAYSGGPIERERIESALLKFTGEFEQMPPIFSAKKIKGVPAYKLARKGEKVVLEPKKITIHAIDIMAYEWPILRVRVRCSSGTYVRSLAHDLGEALGCGGYLTELRRTRIGAYSVDQAEPLPERVP